MEKFVIPPDQETYSVEDGNEVVSAALDGGMSRTRRDILGATSMLNVSWELDRLGYLYARAFYNSASVKASMPFRIDLLMDSYLLTEHVAKFVPNSFALADQEGLKFVVTAKLEVIPLPADDNFNLSWIVVVEAYGAESDLFFNELEQLVNFDLPQSLV